MLIKHCIFAESKLEQKEMFEWCYNMGFTPSQFAKWYRAHELKEANSSTISSYTDYIISQQSNCETLPNSDRRKGLIRRFLNKIWK